MIVPFPALWGSQRTLQPDHRIDRALYHRTHRLIAAIAYHGSFDQINGSLSVAVGHGKFIRLKHSVCRSVPIPPALRSQCLEIADQQQSDIGIIQPVLADLAAVQASLIETLKVDAGKYVDRVMAIAIKDPGIWRTDFDRRPIYTSFCDPATLAELTGMNVIDAFPARDLLVGGSGHPLDGLPLWLLLAERTTTVSKTDRWLLILGDPVQLYFLPASDGLDAELPDIKYFTFPLNSQEINDQVSRRLEQETRSNRAEILITESTDFSSNQTSQDLTIELKKIREQLKIPIPMIDLSSIAKPSGRSTEGDDPVHRAAVNNWVSSSDLSANIAAILGLMHIDQMAGNLPWLTGAESQRILGRLTPGRPSQWRQLIRSMADHQPAAMKLKDAV